MLNHMPGHLTTQSGWHKKLTITRGLGSHLEQPLLQSMNPCVHLSSINPRWFIALLYSIIFIRGLLICLQRQIKFRLKSESMWTQGMGFWKPRLLLTYTVVLGQLAVVPKGEQSLSRARQMQSPLVVSVQLQVLAGAMTWRESSRPVSVYWGPAECRGQYWGPPPGSSMNLLPTWVELVCCLGVLTCGAWSALLSCTWHLNLVSLLSKC